MQQNLFQTEPLGSTAASLRSASSMSGESSSETGLPLSANLNTGNGRLGLNQTHANPEVGNAAPRAAAVSSTAVSRNLQPMATIIAHEEDSLEADLHLNPSAYRVQRRSSSKRNITRQTDSIRAAQRVNSDTNLSKSFSSPASSAPTALMIMRRRRSNSESGGSGRSNRDDELGLSTSSKGPLKTANSFNATDKESSTSADKSGDPEHADSTADTEGNKLTKESGDPSLGTSVQEPLNLAPSLGQNVGQKPSNTMTPPTRAFLPHRGPFYQPRFNSSVYTMDSHNLKHPPVGAEPIAWDHTCMERKTEADFYYGAPFDYYDSPSSLRFRVPRNPTTEEWGHYYDSVYPEAMRPYGPGRDGAGDITELYRHRIPLSLHHQHFRAVTEESKSYLGDAQEAAAVGPTVPKNNLSTVEYPYSANATVAGNSGSTQIEAKNGRAPREPRDGRVYQEMDWKADRIWREDNHTRTTNVTATDAPDQSRSKQKHSNESDPHSGETPAQTGFSQRAESETNSIYPEQPGPLLPNQITGKYGVTYPKSTGRPYFPELSYVPQLDIHNPDPRLYQAGLVPGVQTAYNFHNRSRVQPYGIQPPEMTRQLEIGDYAALVRPGHANSIHTGRLGAAANHVPRHEHASTQSHAHHSPNSQVQPESAVNHPPRKEIDGKKHVKFGHVQIRTYETIMGDNPSCSGGPSLGLGWRYDPAHYTATIDQYELYQAQLYGDSENRPEDLVLHRYEREAILLNAGYSRHELAEAVRGINKVKNRRRQTVHNLPVAWIEEQAEICRRTLRRLVLKKERTRHLYEDWKKSNSSLNGALSDEGYKNAACQRKGVLKKTP